VRRRTLLLLWVCGLLAAAQLAPDDAALGRAAVGNLAAGHYAAVEREYAAKMAAALPPGRLALIWRQVEAQAGRFQAILKATVVGAGGYNSAVLTCQFARARLNVVVSFDRDGRLTGLHFAPAAAPPPTAWTPPAYAHPADFHEQAVTVGRAPWALAGTLTLPRGPGPFPAVVLVHGSGPEDADETIGPNKPFKDLAWGLASRGVAVLRYVKRTRRYGGEIAAQLAGFTVKQESIQDARAAVELLAQRADIQPHAIFLLGHSQGGYLAPRIARGDAAIAGIISLAGSSRPLLTSALEQLHYLASLQPQPSPAIQKQIEAVEKAQALVDSPGLKPADVISVLGGTIPGSYFLDLRGYHPGAVAAGLPIPILVLQGGRDYQVTQADLEGWKRALAQDPRASFEFFPDLDHLFMVGGVPPSPQDYRRPGHVSAAVIQAIESWIQGKN